MTSTNKLCITNAIYMLGTTCIDLALHVNQLPEKAWDGQQNY